MICCEIHPAAQYELEEAFEHYLGIDEELGYAFNEHYRRHRDAILAAPLHYNLRRSPTRRVNLVPQFRETYIAYMLWREKVAILAVGHAKRRPYYWRKRISESREIF